METKPISPLEDDLLVPEKNAELWSGKRPKTMANERCAKRNKIPYLKIGSRIYYRLGDLKAYRSSCLVMPATREGK